MIAMKLNDEETDILAGKMGLVSQQALQHQIGRKRDGIHRLVAAEQP